jgi:hypothetical protein
LNKVDLRDEWEIERTDCEGRGWPTHETSAKDGTGVEEMFYSLAEKLLSNGAANEDPAK